MSAVLSAGKALDPKDDVSGAEFKEDMVFFKTEGGPNLVRELFWQTVRDMVIVNKTPDSPADIRASANWTKTPLGRHTVEFLMPSVSADRIIAKLYENPQLFLTEMALVNKGVVPESLKLSESGVSLDEDVAASVFLERPVVSEDDQPLADEHHGADEGPYDSRDSIPSWG